MNTPCYKMTHDLLQMTTFQLSVSHFHFLYSQSKTDIAISVWSQPKHNQEYQVVMELTLDKNDWSINDVKIHVQKSKKCSQCDFTSPGAYNLRRHLKAHSGEKSNKCNQCDYASSQAGDLRRHSKTHSGGSKKCNQWNCTSFFQTVWLHA